jgi:UDPglucose 6-dehydrogenase
LEEVADYWEQVIIMNDHQKKRFAKKVIRNLYNTVSGKKIAFLGWAFKKDTNDTRESAAIYVADHLLNEQSRVSVYDPKVTEQQIYNDLDYLGTRSNEDNREFLEVGEDPYKICKEAHAIAILTEWDEFKTYDWKKIYDSMLKPAHIFDGRNIMDKKALIKIGFQVHSIGSADDN